MTQDSIPVAYFVRCYGNIFQGVDLDRVIPFCTIVSVVVVDGDVVRSNGTVLLVGVRAEFWILT